VGPTPLALRAHAESVLEAQARGEPVGAAASDALMSALCTRLAFISHPSVSQPQCDAAEFLLAILDAVRDDPPAPAAPAAATAAPREDPGVRLSALSRGGPAAEAELADALRELAARAWAADVHVPAGGARSEPDGGGERGAACFVGQMVTLTARGDAAVTAFESQAVNLWNVPLADGGSADGVPLEALLKRYCAQAGVDDGSALLRTTRLWRLPESLVLVLMRFNNDLEKDETAVRIPPSLDLSPAPGALGEAVVWHPAALRALIDAARAPPEPAPAARARLPPARGWAPAAAEDAGRALYDLTGVLPPRPRAPAPRALSHSPRSVQTL
jgi:hypothetical protein